MKNFIEIIKNAALILLLNFPVIFSHAATQPPVPLNDDAGERAFVKQLVPKLLGRKPRGMLEVNMLADIANLHGREALVKALMALPEFKTHWTALLVDHLQVKRESVGALPASCFNSKMLNPLMMEAGGPGGDPATGLADFIIENEFLMSYPQTFNLNDVISSSISKDVLMPIYRAYLFVLAANPLGASMTTEAERRAQSGKLFNEIFLNRNKECITCHNSSYSTTGIGDRTHPLYSSIDIALFDPNGGAGVDEIDSDAFQNSCSGCHGVNAQGGGAAGGIVGATLSEINNAINTVPLMAGLSVLSDEVLDEIASALETGPFAGNNLMETNSMNDAFFRTDFFELDDPQSGWGPWGISTECASINGVPTQGSIPGFFAGVEDNYLSPMEIDTQFSTGVQKLDAQVHLLPALNDGGVLDGDLTFAYRVAATITENIWQQLMGERLSISNQYPRNAHQRNMLAYLTEEHFIKNDWSLKSVILAITTSRFFNRAAPEYSSATHPYQLQALFEPFVPEENCRVNYEEREDDDRGGSIVVTGNYSALYEGGAGQGDRGHTRDGLVLIGNDPCMYNGQGDLVHRYSPRSLVYSVAKIMNWPQPELMATNNYPSADFMKAIGQYWSALDAGDKDVGFQSLLNWDAEYGVCSSKKSGDWLTKLDTAIDVYQQKNPTSPLTLEDLVMTLKDWIIQEPDLIPLHVPAAKLNGLGYLDPSLLPPSERALLEDFFGQNLDEEVGENPPSDKLRELCGVYLKSPQFMLAGLARNNNFDLPKLRVCNSGACTYQQMCSTVANQLNLQGYDTVCYSQSVGKGIGGYKLAR